MSRSPYLVGLSNPLSLAMLWVSLFTGLLAAWWLLPVGLLVWAVMVWSIARDPLLRMNYAMKQRTPLAPRFQDHFDQIERAQVGIFNAVASAPSSVQRALRSVSPEVDRLVNEVHRLCERMTVLENYRSVTQSTLALGTMQEPDAGSDKVTDPMVRREMEEARLAREGHHQKLQTIETQLDRVEAQLVTLANEMDHMLADIVQTQAIGPELAAQRAPALVKQIRQQVQELKSFEREAERMKPENN